MDSSGVNVLPFQWEFPRATRFNKIVAKDKILKQTPAAPAEKKLFRHQIQKVRCSHEITAESMNINGSNQVPKILVIQLAALIPEPDKKVLSCVDRAFGVPVIFDIIHGKCSRYVACYRHRSGSSDKAPWTFSPYFFGPWRDEDASDTPLPLALSLDILYEKLLTGIMPLPLRENEPFTSLVERWEALQRLNQDMERLEARIKKEKQFNRRVDLNRSLNQLKKQIEDAYAETHTCIEGVK